MTTAYRGVSQPSTDQSPADGRRGRGRPANSSTEQTMQTVLRSARALFAERGYAATSNRMVAERAGLAHTAIYNHFGSKAGLFTAVFADVQEQLITELERSANSAPDGEAFPRALLDAIEAMRAADPSSVEFLASMYVEVRRHPELREIFQAGEQFPIVDTLRSLGARGAPDGSTVAATGDDSTWFWITFALGLAQLAALADLATFTVTVETFRRQFHLTERPKAPQAASQTAREKGTRQ